MALKSSIKYIELFTAIIGTIYYYKYRHTFLKHYLVILWYITFTEFLGYTLRKLNILNYNAILYNLYHVINFVYLFLLYQKYISNTRQKNCVRVFVYLYLASFLVCMLFENYLYKVQTVPFLLASVFLVISISFYFLEILNTDKVLYIRKNLLFWLSVGLLLYYVGNMPFRVIRNFYEDIPNIYNIYVSFISIFILSIIMNICIIIGFIWSEKDNQY